MTWQAHGALAVVLLLAAVVGAVVIARKRRMIETGDTADAPGKDTGAEE